MNNATSCSLSAPQPPTNSFSCAVPISGNNSDALASCCGGSASLASYGDANEGTTDCYQYCNITSSDVEATVLNCLSTALGNQSHEATCYGNRTSTTKASSAHRGGIDKVMLAALVFVVGGWVLQM